MDNDLGLMVGGVDVGDPERLAAVQRSGLADSSVEDSFDRVTRLAARLLDVPVSLVSIVTADRQFFKSQQGLDEPWASRRETPLSHSFCQYVVADDGPLVVDDARSHSLVSTNAAIEDLGVAAYLGIPIRDGAGQPLGALCVIDHQPRRWNAEDLAVLEDLAGFLRTEMRLREASAQLLAIARHERATRQQRERDGDLRFRRLADNSTDAIWVLRRDPDPVVAYLNAAIEELTGYRPEELMDDPDLFRQMFSTTDRQRLQPALEGHSPGPIEVQLRHRDGSARWISVSTTVLTGQDGQVELVQGVARDIEQRKRAAAALEAILAQERQAADRAARLSQMTSTFLTAISHELRTPLTSVLGFADLLTARRSQLSDDQLQHFLQRLHANAQRLQQLLLDALDVDALTRGGLQPDLRTARLDSLVDHATSTARVDREQLTITVPPIDVLCDPGHLERIIINLTDNAAKHTPPGTPIVIHARAEDEQATLIIEDHGPGIPDHLKDQIFQPFVHGPQAAQAASPGTGLGLTLARELARLNGGNIELHDRPGGGTRFAITLRAPTTS